MVFEKNPENPPLKFFHITNLKIPPQKIPGYAAALLESLKMTPPKKMR